MDRVLLLVRVRAQDLAVQLKPPPSREEPSARWMERLARILRPFDEVGHEEAEADAQAFRCCLLGSLEDVCSHLWRHQVLWMHLHPLEEGGEGGERHVAVSFSELIEASADLSGGRYANEVTLEDEGMDASERLTVGVELEVVRETAQLPEAVARPALQEAFILQLRVAEGNSTVIVRAASELGSSGRGLRVRCGNVERPAREGISHTLVLVQCWAEVSQALAELDACLQVPLEDGSDFVESPLDFSELASAAEARGGADCVVGRVKSQDLPSLGEALIFSASVRALRWSAQGAVEPGRSKDSELIAGATAPSPRTWRISVEVRSVRFNSRSANAFAAYSYGPLQQPRPFRTSPPTLARKGATAYLPHAFAAYTLAGTPEELRVRLEEPLRVEVWQRDVYKKDGLLGFSEAAVAPVFERPLQHSPSMPSMVHGFRALDQALPIVGAEEPEPERLGVLRLLVFLEDLGPSAPEPAVTHLAPLSVLLPDPAAAGEPPVSHALPVDGAGEALLALAAIGSNAYELELWRRGEEAKFKNQLAEQEASAMERLDEEYQQRELMREREFRQKQGELKDIEAKVRQKLQDLRSREVAVVGEEARVVSLRDEVQRRTVLAVRDYEDASRRQATEAQEALQLAQARSQRLEGRLQDLQRDLAVARRRAAELETDLKEHRGRLESTPAAQAQQELEGLRLQIEEQQREAEELKASREHFRVKVEELCRHLQPPPRPPAPSAPPPAPLARAPDLREASAGARAPGAPAALSATLLPPADTDMFGVAQALRRVQDELGQLAADWSPPPAPAAPVEVPIAPTVGGDSSAAQHLAWLCSQREELLQSGLYGEGDAVLQAIDRRIAEARIQCGIQGF